MRIFILDDNASEVDLLRIAFEESNQPVEFVHALNVAEVFEQLQSFISLASAMPQMLILDFHLAVDTSESVLAFVGQHDALRRLPIAVLSASLSASEQHLINKYNLTFWEKPGCFDGYMIQVKRIVAHIQDYSTVG